MPLTSVVAAAGENAILFLLVQRGCGTVCGKGRVFILEGPFTQVQMPFHHKISAPGMRDTRRKEDGVCSSGKHGEEQLR